MELHRSPVLRVFYYFRNLKISRIFSEDISFGEFIMLQMIEEMEIESGNSDIWISDIVKRVEVTPQAISKFIKLAEKKAFLERVENPVDHRSTGIRFTENGRRVLGITSKEMEAFRRHIAEDFTGEELETLHRLFRKLEVTIQNNYNQFKKR